MPIIPFGYPTFGPVDKRNEDKPKSRRDSLVNNNNYKNPMEEDEIFTLDESQESLQSLNSIVRRARYEIEVVLKMKSDVLLFYT